MSKATFRLYAECVELLVDLTPPWWFPSDAAVRDAVWRALNAEPIANEIVAIDFGIHGIKVRCAWPQDQSQEAVTGWRRMVLATFDALPEAQDTIRIHREVEAERAAEKALKRGRRFRFPSRAAVVYGCGHERAIDPTKPALLDTEERCPTCAA